MARVGADLSKRVFQVQAVDRAGRLLQAKAMSPDRFFAWSAELPAGCLVAMEACGGPATRSKPKTPSKTRQSVSLTQREVSVGGWASPCAACSRLEAHTLGSGSLWPRVFLNSGFVRLVDESLDYDGDC